MTDKVLFNQPFGSLEKLFSFVELGWKDQEEVELTIGQITRKDQIPKWEDCPRNHFYFAVKRRKLGDLIIVVKHHTSIEFDCKTRAEKLAPKDLLFTVWPEQKDMHCIACGEFSTRIDMDKKCVDCHSSKQKSTSLAEVL